MKIVLLKLVFVFGLEMQPQMAFGKETLQEDKLLLLAMSKFLVITKSEVLI